jgi:membrane-bound lytic murein transglycosylase D
MQLLLNVSKFLVFALLSWSLLITWNNRHFTFIDFDFNYYNPVENKIENEIEVKKDVVTNPSVGSIWNTISNEFQLDHKAQSTRVKKEIRKLLADQDNLYKILKAAGPYIYYIHQQTKTRGLPAELALIPFVESEFNPYDKSNKGATGLWQLMSGTAHILGVKVKQGYDGRRNVIASTRAALTYFKDLGVFFNGNWYLAIAAYNCGQGKIQSAMRHSGSKSYWDLSLPTETKLYVPKLLAVAAIIKNPKKYGVKLPTINNAPYFVVLKTQKSVNLNQIAKSSGISVETLKKLNPDYNKQQIKKENIVLVPVEKASSVRSSIIV